MASPIHQLSADAALLYAMLKEAKTGDTITYAAMTAHIHRDVQSAARPALTTARHKCLKSDGMVFGTISGEGLKRLDDSGIVDTGAFALKKIRRASRRGYETLTKVQDFGALPRDAQLRHNQCQAAMGALMMFSDQKKIAKLTINNPTLAALPIGDTLKQFESSEGIR